jgi:hypothetical protein
MSTLTLIFTEDAPAPGYAYERAETDPPTDTPHRFLSIAALNGDTPEGTWIYAPLDGGRTVDGTPAGAIEGDGAILVVLTRPLPGAENEADYNRWYDERHLGDVLDVIGGFTAARRYKRVGDAGDWPYIALYRIPDGAINHCVQRLAWSRVEREEAEAAGREPAVPLSPGMDLVRSAWWYEPLSSQS